MKKIKLFIENDTPLNQYVFEFIFEIIGIPCKQVSSNDEAKVDIYYGNNPQGINYDLLIISNSNDIIWNDLLCNKLKFEELNDKIDFDIINAIKCFLTDIVNSDVESDAFDKHGRLRSLYSYQERNNIDSIPIVNVYISFLKIIIKHNLSITGIPLWPKNKQCAIGLSHDVDNPEKYAIFRSPIYLTKRNSKENIYLLLRKLYYMKMFLVNRNPNDYWLFDKIIDYESGFGFKSTFNFSSQNIGGKWGSGYDVPYDIRSKKFVEVFDKIKDNGFEIGLHASYYAHLSLNRFVLEKNELDKISGFDVKGLRHHYWSMGNDIENTLKLHEKAGFIYDSSVSFNDSIGYRRNVALPYYPWIQKNSCAINTVQLPVFFMDAHFRYPSSLNQVEHNIKVIKKYIDSIKKYQGLGVIDTHVRTSYPQNTRYINYAKTYQKVLNYLSEDSEIWVDNLINISSWLRERKALLNRPNTSIILTA